MLVILLLCMCVGEGGSGGGGLGGRRVNFLFLNFESALGNVTEHT